MSRKGGGALQKDAPWRPSSIKPIPKIHHSPILRVPNTPHSAYALSIIKHPNPIGTGLAADAIVEAAGPDCIVPGLVKPIRLLGLQVWPVEVDLKFLEPVGKELKLLGKFMDDAVNLMNKSFIDRQLLKFLSMKENRAAAALLFYAVFVMYAWPGMGIVDKISF